MQALASWLYSGLTVLAQPLLRRKLARRARSEPGYGQAIEERFGTYTQQPESRSELLWIHAVSLGETRAAAILIAALREQLPGLRLLLTHGTATGREQGQALLRPGDVQVWQPWDTPAATARFFAHFRPRLGVLMETEVWPNWVAQAQAHAVPVVLANARLSDLSLQRALRLSALARPAYRALSAVLAQTEGDAQRLRTLGAPVQAVLGNLKFDATPDARLCALGQQRRAVLPRPVLMMASSREGEEAALLKALAALPPPWPFELLIVARHPQRFAQVAELIEGQGYPLSRRSDWGADLAAWPPPAGTVWLGDSLGEMALYYSLAGAALLGGSFERLGGQNLIEAAACGCPVIMGPHTFNFSEVAEQALQEEAGAAVADFPQALQLALQWFARDDRPAGAKALAFAQRHRGAALATASHVKAVWQSDRS
ncbi:MAG: 3-deoxy-D-manno-octulosonic acid transferase [Betaproteobacteria bacterium]